MPQVEMRFENMDEVQAAMRRYGDQAQAAIARAVRATGVQIRSDIQRRIQRGPHTGEVYERGSIAHQASAPGESPATDTGFLVSSIEFKMTGPATAQIESRLGYAYHLEFGTVHIAPRPAWTPSIEAQTPEFNRRIREAIAGLV